MPGFETDRTRAAAYIADFLPELGRLANDAGHDVLGYLLGLAEAEAKLLCEKTEKLEKRAG